MKLKSLVLIGSLIAFSSCANEEKTRINKLDLDSELFGIWTKMPDGEIKMTFFSDGMCTVDQKKLMMFNYYAVKYENPVPHQGRITLFYKDNIEKSRGHAWDYNFNGDTLVIDDKDKYVKY